MNIFFDISVFKYLLELLIESCFLYVLCDQRVQWIPQLVTYSGVDQHQQFIVIPLLIVKHLTWAIDKRQHYQNLTILLEICYLDLVISIGLDLWQLILDFSEDKLVDIA